ncbi:MAG: hypothetical protein Q8932_09750, partial [Bacteroidota bacterium]|nr:hypothetical protein [Bacteroidota bacterium]
MQGVEGAKGKKRNENSGAKGQGAGDEVRQAGDSVIRFTQEQPGDDGEARKGEGLICHHGKAKEKPRSEKPAQRLNRARPAKDQQADRNKNIAHKISLQGNELRGDRQGAQDK